MGCFFLCFDLFSGAAFYTSQITGGKVYHSVSFLLTSALNIVFFKKQKKQKQKAVLFSLQLYFLL